MSLRFTTRDLLWLTLVVALAIGLWIDHQRVDRIISRQCEYQVKFIQDDAELDTLGVQGWDLCGITDVEGGTFRRAYFKRPAR
jgi:hypothetical protein